MGIERIPADEEQVMTDSWLRAFVSAGCRPCCHGCGDWIDSGNIFRLITCTTTLPDDGVNMDKSRDLETREVMVCGVCTINDVEKKAHDEHSVYNKRRAAGGGCYRVNGKIIH